LGTGTVIRTPPAPAVTPPGRAGHQAAPTRSAREPTLHECDVSGRDKDKLRDDINVQSVDTRNTGSGHRRERNRSQESEKLAKQATKMEENEEEKTRESTIIYLKQPRPHPGEERDVHAALKQSADTEDPGPNRPCTRQ
jgi:hypothetical protein